MKKTRLWAAMLLCLFLFFSLQISVPAETADVNSASTAAAGFLKQNLPAPGLADGQAVFALLRGNFITPTESYTQTYLQVVLSNAQQGGVKSQPAAQSAWQVLALQAAGVNVAADAPALLEAVANREALTTEGFTAQYLALVVFGAAKNPVPPASGFDLTALVNDFAAQVNEDNGFGANGVSNATATAQAIQALSAHASSNPAAYTVLENAQFWLQLNTNDEGGFDNSDGISSSDGVAEAMLAMSALGYDPASVSFESAYLAQVLVGFQSPDGGIPFLHNTPATTESTSLGLLGLIAKIRFDRSNTTIFDTSDVPPLETAPTSPSAPPAGGTSLVSGPQSEASGTSSDTAAIPLWVTLGAGGGLVLVLLLVFFLAFRGKKRTQPKRRSGSAGSNSSSGGTKDKHVYRKRK